MASGGMGDLLTGIIAALRAEGLSQTSATIAGACIHGRAGYLAGELSGVIGTIASDLLPYVRLLVNQRLGLIAKLQNQAQVSEQLTFVDTSKSRSDRELSDNGEFQVLIGSSIIHS